MSFVTGLRCLDCDFKIDAIPFKYVCPKCGGYLEVEYDYAAIGSHVNSANLDSRQGSVLEVWKEFLPIEKPELVSQVTLGEKPTSMTRAFRLPSAAESSQVWLKHEFQSPTCSLKDRSLSLVILKALEHEYKSVGIVSSGNASASLAAYAARAGLKAIVFLEGESTPSKISKTMQYQPIAIQVDAPYSEAELYFQQARDEFGFLDCNGIINPYRVEGKKTFAYEVARDLHWKAPDVVFMPCGYGSGVVAAWKGFQELYRLGLTNSLPAIVAVQAELCSPIARAFQAGKTTVDAVPPVKSIAESVCVSDPVIGGKRSLQAVRESNGLVIAVSEEEIHEAVHLLATTQGLAIEPTGAVGFAGLLKTARESQRWAGGVQVASLTGHGLNAPVINTTFDSLYRFPAQYSAISNALGEILS